MIPASPYSRPSFPLSVQEARGIGNDAANSFAIRVLIRLLDQSNGRREFQEELSNASIRPQPQIYCVLNKWYGGSWANRATKTDEEWYPGLRDGFTNRIRQIGDICQAVLTNSSDAQSSP